MRPTLRIRLLGGLDLRLGDAQLPPLESARAESLLAYLLLHRDAAQPRQRLAFLLWPDSTEPQARTNLRHVLHNLRRALPDADQLLEVTPRTLRWRADADVWLDVAAFEEALARVEDNPLDALRAAVDAYTGDLLEGSYDEWLVEERERLRDRHLDALERLTSLLEERGEHPAAIRYAERLLRHDPLREQTYRLLMRLHTARGDRARALRVFHACAAALERELGVAPSPRTREAYEALLPAGEADTDRATPASPSGPLLIGRGREATRLIRLWEASARGRAQLLLVTGEPGIGKTRLVQELRSWCARRGVATAEASSYPGEGALAYGPVVAWLRSPQLAAGRRRLDRGRLAELGHLLPELAVPPPEPLPVKERRRRVYDALARAILAPAAPLLLVADDLHWADRETLGFLYHLIAGHPDASLLVAASVRSDEIDDRHPVGRLATELAALERCVELELERLSRSETALLAERLAGTPLEPPDADRLFAGTEGNPLFVVEAIRAGWAAGGGDAISPRVQAVIEARLARLSDRARELVGVAATVGREFTTEVLADAGAVDEADLVGPLDELWRRRIVRDSGPAAYDFTHDRIREVAYASLGPARRRRTHLMVAGALERRHAGDLDAVSGQLGAHYERAGDADRASFWHARAADVAQRLYADEEASALLARALALVATLPAGAARDGRELELITAALVPLVTAEGHASNRLHDLQRRGLELARRLGVEPAPPLLRSLALTALAASDFERSRGFAEQLRSRGQRDDDDVLLVECDYVLGISAFWQGRLHAARRHFEAAVRRYRPQHRMTHLMRYGLDPQVVCLSRLGNTLWLLGRPGAAAQARDAALALGDEIAHPLTASTARWFAALLAVELRDAEGVRGFAADLAARSRELDVKPIRTGMDALAGYVEVLDGRWDSGLHRIRHSLQHLDEAEDAPGLRAGMLRLLAEGCAVAGDAHGGVAATELLLGNGAGAVWRAEALRLRAGFRSELGAGPQEVAAELEHALAVARRQGARSLELRTAVSIVRHRGEGARDVLATALARLPEAEETPDRLEAEALLHRGTAAERPVLHRAPP